MLPKRLDFALLTDKQMYFKLPPTMAKVKICRIYLILRCSTHMKQTCYAKLMGKKQNKKQCTLFVAKRKIPFGKCLLNVLSFIQNNIEPHK